jgi:hypothetical protein
VRGDDRNRGFSLEAFHLLEHEGVNSEASLQFLVGCQFGLSFFLLGSLHLPFLINNRVVSEVFYHSFALFFAHCYFII